MVFNRFLETSRFRIVVSLIIAMLPVLIFVAVATEYLLIPSIEKSVKQELVNSNRILTNSIQASASIAIRNHLKAIAEKNRDIALQHMSLVNQGLLTKEEAIKRLKAIFLNQHIGKSGYVYCLDHNGIAVVHPNAEVENTENKSFGFVREQIERKEGYIEYNWQNPGENSSRPKALYMVYFEPLDWIISVSSYKSEFNDLTDPRDFSRAVLSLRFGENGYAFVLNREDKILIHPKLKYLTNASQGGISPDFLQFIHSHESGTIEYTWHKPGETKDRQKIAAFEKIPEYGWIVASSAYFDEVMNPVNLTIRLTHILTFLILLAAVLAAYFLGGRLSRPINAMLHQLDRNARNGTFESLPVYIGNEHGRLALEFNKYLKTITTQSEQLQRERERYRSLFESSPDAIFLLRGTTLIDCNPATTIIFASTKEVLIGRTILDLSPPTQARNESSSGLAEKITQQSAKQNLQTFDWIHKAMDGRLFKAEVRLKPFGTDNGEPLMVAFVRDITEQKQVEEALRLTQFSFDKASFGIFRSGPEGQILNANEQACRSLGYTKEELCKMSIFDIDPSITAEKRRDLWQKRREKSSIFESYHRSKDGRIFPVQITSSLLEYEGTQHSISFVRDITEEKEIEKQKAIMESNFRQAQRMEALGTLAGGIAHDFNNILSAIMGYTELTQMESLGNVKIQSYLSHLREASKRAKNLVQQILSFTRQGVSEKHPIDIGKVINEALDLIRATVPSTIEISQNFAENLGIVFADETQIHQVVMNLCTNAYQAMEKEGGRLEVDLLPVIITDKDIFNYPDMNLGAYLKLAITDTGCGIEPDKISKGFLEKLPQ